MNNELHAILEQVAAGTITPEQADEAIAALPPTTPEPEPVTPAKRIMIRGGALKLTVVGDPTVSEAVAEGSHRLERDGDLLVVHTNPAVVNYSVEPPRSAFMNWLGEVMNRDGGSLVVRVNPALPLQVLVVGGALQLSGVHAGASIGVEAGSAQVSDGSGPLMLDVSTGSAKVNWTFTGECRVRVDMGSAQVTARPDSNVTVTAEASFGQATVTTPDGTLKAAKDGPTVAVPVGAGEGTLAVRAQMGSAQVVVAT